MADELAKKISELDNLPNGDMDGFFTIGSKDNAQGNPVSYKMNLVVLKNAIAAAAAAVAEANNAASAAQAAELAFLQSIVQQTGQNTDKTMSQKAVTDALAAIGATVSEFTGKVGDIIDMIPSAASSSNQLADKNFVNSSIGTSTATYISNNGEPFTSVSQLNAYTGPHDKNDYAFVVSTDAAGNTVYSRYKYDGSAWAKEYDLNNSSFTAAQWAAINSAVTAALVEKLSALPDNATLTAALAAKQDVIEDLSSIRSKANSAYQKPSGGIPKTDLASAVQTSLNKADSAIQYVSDKADKTELEALAEEVAKKANVEGYYGGLTAGSAENLVGRGSVEAEIQGIRTSAGQEDIGTGAAIIREVRGKSVVWNQLVENGDFSDGDTGWRYGARTSISVSDGILTINRIQSGSSGSIVYPQSAQTILSHKYYCRCLAWTGDGSHIVAIGITERAGSVGSRVFASTTNTTPTWISVITEPVASTDNISVRLGSSSTPTGKNAYVKNVIAVDLTLMFGAGNEPATVEEFERMFPLPYYLHNEGTIINNEATGLRTRGFNLFNPVTGKAVLPGKYSDYPYEYEICGAFTQISFEDYAGNVSTPELTDGRFFNVDAPGVLTVVGGNATDTCVHLVWSGWRNYGEPDYVYEPYWENTLPINIKTITGKLNGEGESVVIFPNGMRSAGSAYDRLIVDPDGFARRAEVRIGSVDMGTLPWTGSATTRYTATLNTLKIAASNSATVGMLTIPYAYVPSGQVENNDKVISSNNGTPNGTVMLKDTAITTTADVVNTLSGVPLYFELATPLEYTLDEPIPLTYMVDDFGTEAKLPVDTATLPTGPLRFAVTYPFNAVDKLRRLQTNYLSKESTEAMLNALQSAGIIGGYTMTYNATTEQYTFTITAPSVTPDETTE